MSIDLDFLLNGNHTHTVNESFRVFSETGILNCTFPLPHADHNMDYVSKIEQWYQFSHDILFNIDLSLYDNIEDEYYLERINV
jgi:hypothetical protein